jgi:hypothetical protein
MKAKFIHEAIGFTQDSDPIEDMGIGNSFNHLRVGTILKANKIIRITSRTGFSEKGRIIAWPDQYIVVIQSEPTQLDKKKIKVWYQNGGELAHAENISKNIAEYRSSLFNSMTGTAKQYQKRFTIVQ